MIVNKFVKKCQSCGVKVAIGNGFAYKNGNGWFTVCASEACHRKLGLKTPTREHVRREITDDGKLYMPFDRDAIPLIRSMPGAIFNPEKLPNNQVYWKVSILPKDLPRVLEVAEQLQLDVSEVLKTLAAEGTEESREALERAERKRSDGATLFAYQKKGVEFLALHDRAILADDMGLGKAMSNGTPVLTPNGWVPIEELVVGDEVIGRDGKPHKVTGVYPQGVLPIYDVVFSDGRSVQCSEDHLWSVQTPNDRVRNPDNFRTHTLKEIVETGLEDHNGNRKWFIPVIAPIEHSEKDFAVHPYILGAMLANGSFSGTISHIGLPEQREVLEKLGVSFEHHDYQNKWTNTVHCNELKNALQKYGLRYKNCYSKFIPEDYFWGSVEQRLALLQGLVDNEGTVSKDGIVVEYNTSSSQLADDVIRLVRSLGGVVKFSTRKPKYTYKGEVKIGSTDHRIRIKLPSHLCPVTIPFKKDRFTANSKYPPALSIADVIEVGESECTCISVDAEDKLFITKDYIVTHNTVQSLVALPENARVVLIAPAAVKYNWEDEVKMWRPDIKTHICNGENSFRFPMTYEELRNWTVSNFGDCCDCFSPLNDKVGFNNSEEFQNLGNKSFSGHNSVVSISKLGFGNVCSGCSKHIPPKSEVVIITYNILPGWLSEKTEFSEEQNSQIKELTVIADEAHQVKNYKTSRSKKVTALCEKAKRVWFLTGTPLMNRPQDLYGVLQAGNMQVLGSWTKFLGLFNGYKNKFGGYEFGMPSPEVPERMKRVMLRRLKTEVLKDLPPKTYQKVDVPLDKDTIKQLNKFLVEAGMDPKKVETLEDQLETSDLPGFESFSRIRALLAQSRIPAMLEMVEEYEESETPLLVFSAHKAPIEALKGRDGWEIITGDTSAENRFDIMKRFQAGTLKGIGLTIGAGGVGLTLTHASNALFVDLDWTPAMNIQAEDRLCIASGQLVAVKDKGYIPIDDVQVGDLVFTHLGNWKRVLNVHSRQHRKFVTSIKYKRFNQDLVCTHDHKLLVKKQGRSNMEWIEAHSVLPGDFLVVPRKQISSEIQLDSVRFPAHLRHDPSQVNQFGKTQENGRYVELPGFIELNTESLFAFGLYLAQGFSSTVAGKGCFVSWSVHEKNRHQLERIQQWLKTIGVNSSIYDAESHGIELRGYSIELAHWFEYLFGRTCDQKHIPETWLDLFTHEQLNTILQAYLDGDGYRRNSQSEWGTVSQELAMQMNLLSAALGFAPSLKVNDSYEGKTGKYWIGLFTTNPQPSNQALSNIDEQYVYNPISSVKTEFAKRGENKLIVYDLEVEDDESFLVGNAIVHNCRIGQTSDSVLIKRMVSSHPLDKHIQMLLEWKLLLAYSALEASIKFTPPKPRPLAQDIRIIDETDEELAARIRAADDTANREFALGKLQNVAAREAAKVNDVPEPPLTPSRKAMLKEALDYMTGRCDGAVEKDGVGFNRPDAAIGHWIHDTGLRDDDELAFRVLERILCRYRRQLKGQFEEIWKPD